MSSKNSKPYIQSGSENADEVATQNIFCPVLTKPYRRYTCEEIDSWDTDERYELIDGESYEICSVQIQR